MRWFNPFFHGLGLGVVALLLRECGHIMAPLALSLHVKRSESSGTRCLYTVRERGTSESADWGGGAIHQPSFGCDRAMVSLVQLGKLLLRTGECAPD